MTRKCVLFNIFFNFFFFFLAVWNVSRLSREKNSPTAIWWQLSVRAWRTVSMWHCGYTYIYGCVLPTTFIIHQLDDQWPAGDDSCSSWKEVSVAEEEANLEKGTHARARKHIHTHRRTTSLYCQANLHLWSGACSHYSSAQPFKSVQSTTSQWVSRISSQKISEFS